MKKFIAFLMCVMLGFITQAQTLTVTRGAPYSAYVGTAALGDTVGGTATKTWAIRSGVVNPYYYCVVVSLTKLTGAGDGRSAQHSYYTLQGSLNGTDYQTISNYPYWSTADSTIIYSDVSTGVLWRYLRISATGRVANKGNLMSGIKVKVAEKY